MVVLEEKSSKSLVNLGIQKLCPKKDFFGLSKKNFSYFSTNDKNDEVCQDNFFSKIDF